VLELLKNNFGPGDKLVATSGAPQYVYAQGFLTRDGKHKLLLINKRNHEIEVPLAGTSGLLEKTYGATAAVVDQTTQGAPARVENIGRRRLPPAGFGVAVLTLP